jgi:hypothetical protein
MLLFAFTLYAPSESAAQPPVCAQPLATLTVPRSSYAVVNSAPFEGRVYVYVPEIKARGGSGFEPFQVWVVQGVYGNPFVQATGGLDQAGFDKLRQSPNLRATPVTTARGDGSEWGQFRIAKDTYRVQVLTVNASKGSGVAVRVCR